MCHTVAHLWLLPLARPLPMPANRPWRVEVAPRHGQMLSVLRPVSPGTPGSLRRRQSSTAHRTATNLLVKGAPDEDDGTLLPIDVSATFGAGAPYQPTPMLGDGFSVHLSEYSHHSRVSHRSAYSAQIATPTHQHSAQPIQRVQPAGPQPDALCNLNSTDDVILQVPLPRGSLGHVLEAPMADIDESGTKAGHENSRSNSVASETLECVAPAKNCNTDA